MDAFLAGLEQAKANGHDLSKIGSVASFFVSRVDTEIDKRLDKIGTDGGARRCAGKAAVANARLAYERAPGGLRHRPVAGARRRRGAPAAAAVGVHRRTKNPDYRDVIYVEELIAPGVVNTMPEPIIHAFADHGEVPGDTITGRTTTTRSRSSTASTALGVDYDDVVETLEREGVEKFEASWTWSCCRAWRRSCGAGDDERAARRRRARPRPGSPCTVPSAAGGRRRWLAERAGRGRRARAALAAKDPTLWGPEAEAEAKIRLGWVDTFRRSRELLPQLAELRAELADLDHVVLAGMGGSSLAPEVIARTLGVAADRARHHRPAPGRGAALGRPAATQHRRGGVQQVRRHGGDRQPPPGVLAGVPRRRADRGRGRPALRHRHRPGLAAGGDRAARWARYVVLADPDVGGRYSRADRVRPGARGAGRRRRRRAARPGRGARRRRWPATPTTRRWRWARRSARPPPPAATSSPWSTTAPASTGLGDWAEQLIAESTGKSGKGILPVVVETPDSPGATGAGRAHRHRRRRRCRPASVPGGGVAPDVAVNGPLGAQFLAWEYATAVAGRVLGINPFDQPNVDRVQGEHQPDPRRRACRRRRRRSPRARSRCYAAERGDAAWRRAAAALLDQVGDARLPGRDGVPGPVRRRRRRRAAARCWPRRRGRPVTFGWGPRFLHSTGQYHKGGPQVGVVPADHRRGRRGPRGAGQAVHLRRSCRRRRPPATGRRWPGGAARCCTCT